MKRVRQQNGGVYLDRRVNTWYYRRTEDGKRKLTRIGTLGDFPTKAKAELASHAYVSPTSERKAGVTFEAAAQRYIAEKMPTRHTTAGGYKNYLRYCTDKWGGLELDAIEPMEVWRWVIHSPIPKPESRWPGRPKPTSEARCDWSMNL